MIEPPAMAMALQWIVLAYFIGQYGGYLLLNLMSLAGIRRYLEARALDALPQAASRYEPPVSIIVPTFNEQSGIVATVRSLLQLQYPQLEVIVVNDGSTDETLDVLREAFSLGLFPEAYWQRLPVRRVHAVYRSTAFPGLRVIDKSRGGRADALNAGVNAARFPLFCGTRVGCILNRDSLRRMVQPFVENITTAAATSSVRIANGCSTNGGFLDAAGLPGRLLALIQVVEYLRTFLFARLGWSAMNAVLTASGAFDVFRKQTVVDAGGFRSGFACPYSELQTRLHRVHRLAGEPYRVVVVPDPVCWIDVPESLGFLRQQWIHRQRGLAGALSANLRLLFHRRGGAPGWLSFPHSLAFELLGPPIEVLAYALLLAAFAFGLIAWQALAAIMAVAIGFGILLSVSALFLEEFSFRVYRRPAQLLRLLTVVLVENIGYRQLVALWRTEGLIRWLRRARRGRRGAETRENRGPA